MTFCKTLHVCFCHREKQKTMFQLLCPEKFDIVVQCVMDMSKIDIKMGLGRASWSEDAFSEAPSATFLTTVFYGGFLCFCYS